ncbi:MAG TPA: hypothetical protein VFC19_44715 [Candidatus Limnocylindrales bacterium]|nr:hypothetical protein [Candidatus Limnocylindrales bacterium]
MIWLTWRQHRGQFLLVFAILAVVTAVMVPIGLRLRRAFAESGLADCTAALSPSVLNGSGPADPAAIECARLAEEFNFLYGMQGVIGLVLPVLVPLAFGVVIGTQLVGDDADHGTHRLVWTQGVTRNRWLATKFGLVAAVAAVFAAAVSALEHWYSMPIVRSGAGRILLTDVLGATPVAYALFAVALGLFTGAMWRKVPPAVAATLFGFMVVRLAVRSARPHFIAPLERRLKVFWDPAEIEFGSPYWLRLNGDWDLGQGMYDEAGRLVNDTGMRTCPSPLPADTTFVEQGCDGNPAFPKVDYNIMLYHPDSRFWTFQLIEIAIFLGLTVLLAILTVRRVSRLT